MKIADLGPLEIEISPSKSLYLGQHPKVERALKERYDTALIKDPSKDPHKFTLNQTTVSLLSKNKNGAPWISM
jgi:hypothetical protein